MLMKRRMCDNNWLGINHKDLWNLILRNPGPRWMFPQDSVKREQSWIRAECPHIDTGMGPRICIHIPSGPRWCWPHTAGPVSHLAISLLVSRSGPTLLPLEFSFLRWTLISPTILLSVTLPGPNHHLSLHSDQFWSETKKRYSHCFSHNTDNTSRL